MHWTWQSTQPKRFCNLYNNKVCLNLGYRKLLGGKVWFGIIYFNPNNSTIGKRDFVDFSTLFKLPVYDKIRANRISWIPWLLPIDSVIIIIEIRVIIIIISSIIIIRHSLLQRVAVFAERLLGEEQCSLHLSYEI